MTDRTADAPLAIPSLDRRAPRLFALSRWRIALVCTLLWLVGLGVVGPSIAWQDPAQQSLGDALLPPAWEAEGSWAHPLGTDHLGRDVLSRLFAGAQVSLMVGAVGVLLAAAIGAFLGILAGYVGGWVDAAIGRAIEIAMALPAILLALLFASFVGPGLSNVIIILALVGWMGYARVIRAEVLVLRSVAFVEYAKVSRVAPPRIMVRHILPNVMNTLIVLASLQVGAVIIFESTLSFVGLGVQAPDVSWGLMLASGRDYISSAWWLSVFPGTFIAITVLMLNLSGEILRDRLDPRLRQLVK